jgi:hypothetical protein
LSVCCVNFLEEVALTQTRWLAALAERPSKTNFIHLRLSHAKQKRSVRSRRLPRHWSLARATMSACVSFASARALRAPRVSQRRPARKVRVPASRARVARALIPADFPPTRSVVRCDVFGARA